MELNENMVISTVYYVGVENELRFVVGAERVSLELLRGFAEICGTELVLNEVYSFPPYTSVSLFTWKGCSVKIRGRTETASVSSETLMMIPVNIHACLEEMRIMAETENKKGPVCLVVGPIQSGKSSFCHFLLNYAARLGRKPLYVDLDVGHNSYSIPGTISILRVKNPSHVMDGFNTQTLSVFTFGYYHPGKNIPFYCLLMKKVGEMLQNQLASVSEEMRSSGVIIDTFGWVRYEGYTAVTAIAYAFQIDVLFVMEDRKLFRKLKKDMPSSVKMVYVPLSEGIVKRSVSLSCDSQNNRVWEYFYGTVKEPLNPHKFEVNFSDIEVYKADTDASVTDVYRIGVCDIMFHRVPIGEELLYSVLGISFADSLNESLLITNIKGFICIVNVDKHEKVITVLSPQPAPLSSKIFILGDIILRRMSMKCGLNK